jgi:EAL domain-containing protein (putative c-di-GMP-specific phosphodiesterase class I)
MDDFGSGYSSLNMLKDMPFDILKLDLRFLSDSQNKGNLEKSQHILRTVIALANSIDLYVVMEGVETENQIDFLKDAGCTCAQGYVYSKPVATAVFEDMLQAQTLNASL